MRKAAPDFPWYKGGIIEFHVLTMQGGGLDVAGMVAGYSKVWSIAGEIHGSGIALPDEYVQVINDQSVSELRRRVAASRGVSPAQVTDAEVGVEPEMVPLNATLALSSAMRDLKDKAPDSPVTPAQLADQILRVWERGPRPLSPHPLEGQGVRGVSFVVLAYAYKLPDPWDLANLPQVNLPDVEALMKEIADRRAAKPETKPPRLPRPCCRTWPPA